MNYRHAFHAGNFADVLKHSVLLAVLDALLQKPAPLLALDTHAGRGLYALDAAAAQRTGEYQGGIARLAAARGLPPPLARYRAAVQACAAQHPRHYPGSPWLLLHALRSEDQAVLCELEPGEAQALRALCAGDARAHVHQRDGYEALPALLPPAQRRGLVLIDPPYEAQEGEFDAIEKALARALQRFAQGVYLVWYPIKLARTREAFWRWLAGCGARSVLAAELAVRTENSPLRMNGCGMAILNPPWKLDAALATALPVLAQLLGETGQGQHRLHWLRRE